MAAHHTGVFQHHQSLPVQPVASAHSSSSPSVNSHGSASNGRQPAGLDHIGKRIHFSTGQFTGYYVRAELIEIQKADLGRKYARVDRRPLDPPPVVLLKLYYSSSETDSEQEVDNYDEIMCPGLLCTVDLFPVPDANKSKNNGPPQSPSSASSQIAFQSPQSSPGGGNLNVNYFTAQAYARQANMVVSPSEPIPLANCLHPHSTSNEVVHRIGDFDVTEGSKQTQALVGATFVQPATVEYQGRKSLVFVFSDLAIKIEGTFILRYRFFDLTNLPTGSTHSAVQAECYGGRFKVYSTKEFPGLQASTELTKQLARWGVRLNIRETERKRRKKDANSVSPPRRKRSYQSASDMGRESDEE